VVAAARPPARIIGKTTLTELCWSASGVNPWTGMSLTRLTMPANLTGLPALSLPVPGGPAGLPASLQLIGPPGGEEQLIALGRVIEAALR
jgi:Asp-tRNA(Asn)/Glu-tRNA(Gln) amidotransferase A subunit family amidase